MPKVSVIIPSYNRANFIVEAIESVLNQTFKDLEIIVVDDGSTDNTRNILMKYNQSIKYIYQNNEGIPCARNTGINASKGEYIALLDSDDAWLPRKLVLEVSILDQWSNVGLVFSDYYLYDGQNMWLRKIKPLSGDIFKHLVLYNFIPSPTVIFRKDCINEVGLFDESLSGLGSEDWDIWLRIAKKYDIFHIEVPLAKYRLLPHSMVRNIEKMLKSQLLVVNKTFSENKILHHKELRLRNKAISNIYYRAGAIYYEKDDFEKSKVNLVQSIKYNPFCSDAYICLMKCMMGKRIMTKLRLLKKHWIRKMCDNQPFKNAELFIGERLQ